MRTQEQERAGRLATTRPVWRKPETSEESNAWSYVELVQDEPMRCPDPSRVCFERCNGECTNVEQIDEAISIVLQMVGIPVSAASKREFFPNRPGKGRCPTRKLILEVLKKNGSEPAFSSPGTQDNV